MTWPLTRQLSLNDIHTHTVSGSMNEWEDVCFLKSRSMFRLVITHWLAMLPHSEKALGLNYLGTRGFSLWSRHNQPVFVFSLSLCLSLSLDSPKGILLILIYVCLDCTPDCYSPTSGRDPNTPWYNTSQDYFTLSLNIDSGLKTAILLKSISCIW